MEEIDLLWMKSTHHITNLGCLLSGLAVSACRLSPASVISDMDAPMRSLGGCTVPDGAVGIFTSIYDGSCWLPQCLGLSNAQLLSSYGSH